MSRWQMGQHAFMLSHWSMHCLWNLCRHGSVRRVSPACGSSRHTVQRSEAQAGRLDVEMATFSVGSWLMACLDAPCSAHRTSSSQQWYTGIYSRHVCKVPPPVQASHCPPCGWQHPHRVQAAPRSRFHQSRDRSKACGLAACHRGPAHNQRSVQLFSVTMHLPTQSSAGHGNGPPVATGHAQAGSFSAPGAMPGRGPSDAAPARTMHQTAHPQSQEKLGTGGRGSRQSCP